MVRARFQNLDRERREELLQAAAEEFAAHGYHGASINRIIERSGMSKGSVYYYFEDKADLFVTTFHHSVERLLDEAGWPELELLAKDEYWDALLELSRRSVSFASRNEWWVRLARSYQRFASEAPETPALGSFPELVDGMWRRIIVRGRELGLVRDDLPVDLLVAIALGADQAGDRWMMERWDDFSADELDRLVEARVDLVRDMLSKEHQGWDR